MASRSADILARQLRMPSMHQITFRVSLAESSHYFFQAENEPALRDRLSQDRFWRQHAPENILVEPVLGDRRGILGEVMNTMPESWRHNWCESGFCGCMGCSNISGSLRSLGFTKEDWLEWCVANPDPRPPVDHEAMKEALFRALSTKH